MPDPQKIVLVGHYGGSNVGDDAMLDALLMRLSSVAPESPVMLVCKSEVLPDSAFTPGVTRISFRLCRIVKALRKGDWIVLGGGTHHMDDYRGRRAFRHTMYMARYGVLFWLARLRGCSTAAVAIGVGPLRSRLGAGVSRWGLAACTHLSVRDEASLISLPSMKLRKRAVLGSDLAFLAEIPPFPETRETVLGICPVFTDTTRSSSSAQNTTFWQELGEELRERLLQNPQLKVRIFVFRGGDRETDCQVAEELKRSLDAEARERVALVPYTSDLQELYRELARCRWFIAARYHSLLLAACCGCQVLPVAYHRKVVDLADDLGLPIEPRLLLEDLPDRRAISRAVTELFRSEPFSICHEAMRQKAEVAFRVLDLKGERRH